MCSDLAQSKTLVTFSPSTCWRVFFFLCGSTGVSRSPSPSLSLSAAEMRSVVTSLHTQKHHLGSTMTFRAESGHGSTLQYIELVFTLGYSHYWLIFAHVIIPNPSAHHRLIGVILTFSRVSLRKAAPDWEQSQRVCGSGDDLRADGGVGVGGGL